jgi:hypothetical protein
MSAQNGLVQRLWSSCNILRDDGLSYGHCLNRSESATAAIRAAVRP